MLVSKTQHAVNQVAPGRHQFVVVAAGEVAPGEIGVTRFGRDGGQVITNRVGIVSFQHVRSPNCPIAAGGQLLALHVQIFVGRYIVWQVQPFGWIVFVERADGHQFAGPDDGVEDNVVLAHKVIGLGGRVVPPLFPLLRLADVVRPLDAGGEIAHHRLEPDV